MYQIQLSKVQLSETSQGTEELWLLKTGLVVL